MDVATFINNYREAFGDAAKLPLAFWYSENPAGEHEKINGCLFKFLPKAEAGITVSLSEQTVSCGGGKFYCGFAPMPAHVPNFVSLKEKYKQTPEMMTDFLDKHPVPASSKSYLNFARIDQIDSFDGLEGLLFMASPEMLSGLATWAYFDNNDDDCVSSIFGSGCSAIITVAVTENRRNGRRTFLGGFDVSVRPYFSENELSFTIPMSRFKEMYATMRSSSLYDTHAWAKVKERIQSKEE